MQKGSFDLASQEGAKFKKSIILILILLRAEQSV